MKYLLVAIFCLFSANFVLAEEKIDINNAPSEDLIKIIHIGEIRARELISLRPFSSLDELTRIKGIGEARLADIKEQGLAWIAPAAVEPAEDEPPPISTENSSPPISTTTEVADVGSPQTLIAYPAGVIINEIMPSPVGADEEEEWIEIFNQNNFEVDISGWKIIDSAGKTEIYIFPGKTAIGPNDFLVLYRPTTKITLNNQGDGLKIIRPDESVIDEVNFENAPRGKSYNRLETSWEWSPLPTPGSANVQEVPDTSAAEPDLIKEEPKEQLAAAGVILDLSQNKSSLKFSYALLTAIILTAFSGIVIFILKRKKG